MARRRDVHMARGRTGSGPATVIGAVCIAIVIALLAAPAGIPAFSGESRSASLQAALERVSAQLNVPGASAAVIQRGRTFWAGTTGTKLRGGGDAVTPQTLFITASSAKTVTAAMTLRLVDEGKLGLDETVGRLLPGLRDGRRITVRELLQHTSGLPNYLTSPRIQSLLTSDPQHAWTRGEVLRAVGWPRFRPGSHRTYSDSNYIALGGVIEAVEGMPLEDAFAQLIRNPLGLTSSSWRYDNSQIDRFAHPNLLTPGGQIADLWSDGIIPTGHWGEVWTDGGLASTASELAEIAHATVMGPLLKRATRQAMLDFKLDGYTGLGVFSRAFLGRDWVGHAGVWAGFTSEQWTYRRRGLTIAVLANLETPGGVNPAEEIFKALAGVALGS